MTRAIGVLGIALLLSGCRDDVPPFQPAVRENAPPSWALTRGPGIDTDPHWSASGDTVMYHTTLLGIVPDAWVTIAGIPYSGGAARAMLTGVPSLSRRYVTPAPSPAGDRFAYVDLSGVHPFCESIVPCTLQPLLDSAVLRVRRVGETGDMDLDPRITIRFPGPNPDYRDPIKTTWVERLFPFQERHRTASEYLFRPTWSPDGERIAFSDGLAIHIWNVGDDATTIVPGTDDAVSAAWSPTGDWIAFTLLARTDSITTPCDCEPVRIPVRTQYITAEPVVVIVRTDGSERIELGRGEDPAWAPDGSSVFARRDSMIVRIPLDGGDPVIIPGTNHGRAPAVSPNGRWLAFSRRKDAQNPQDHDIWITALDQ